MDGVHLHLILNHIPILGTVFGLVFFVVGQVCKEEVLIRMSLGVFVLAGVAAGAAYMTGEPAEEMVKQLAGISEDAVASHENAAFYALISAIVLGLFALGSLVFYKGHLPRPLVVTVMVLALAVCGMMGWTARWGGQIHHPELRSDYATQQDEQARSPEPLETQD